MGTSRDELTAQIQALSLKKHMGVDVKKEEVDRILRQSQSEADRTVLKQLCNALGLASSD